MKETFTHPRNSNGRNVNDCMNIIAYHDYVIYSTKRQNILQAFKAQR